MNKRMLLGLVVIAVAMSNATAQFRIGIVAAPAVTGALNLDVNQREGMIQYPSLGSGAGIPITYDGKRGKGIQTGIYYASTNQSFIFRYKLGEENYTLRGKKRFDFIKIPVLYRRSGRVARFVRTSFAMGVQYSYTFKYGGGLTVYDPGVYFNTPPSDGAFKKHAVDGVLQWGTEIAVKKRLDLFTGLKFEMAFNNMANKKMMDGPYRVFGRGLGWHPYSLSFQVGLLYVLSRQDHMNLPGNTYRFRPYKRKPKQMMHK